MKKIAFMFAVAAMMVACGNGVKTATPEQQAQIKDSLYAAELEAAKAAIEAPAAPEAPAEELDEAGKAAYAEAQAAYDAAIAEYNEAIAAVTVDSTSEAFKAKFAEEVKKFEAALNAPAEKKEGEQAAEGEQK